MNPEQRSHSPGRFNIWVFCAIPVVAAVLGVLNNLRVYEERRVAWPWEDVAAPVAPTPPAPATAPTPPVTAPIPAPAPTPSSAVAPTPSAAAPAPSAAAPAPADVRPEVWTTRFPAALARARAENRPLLLAGGLLGCGGCMRMEQSLEDKIFRAWVKGTGAYLVRFRVNEAASSPDQGAAWKFYQESKLLGPLDKPFVGVYWPRRGGEEVRVGFTYGRGKMPGGSHPALVVEYLKSLDLLLADYLKDLGPRPSVDQLLEVSVKRVAVACEGPGTVSMTPEDGRLVGGESVHFTVRPASGYVVEGWRGPDGALLKRKRSSTLTIPYQSDEGTYTAVLRKR